MQFSTLVTVMAGLATTAWAATPQVEVCKDTQFSGGCTTLTATLGQCCMFIIHLQETMPFCVIH